MDEAEKARMMGLIIGIAATYSVLKTLLHI
jgi:hypothetical protein